MRDKRLAHRNVGSDVDDAQLVGDEHQGEIFGAGLLGQNLGVSGVLESGQLHRFLVQRGGDDRIELLSESQINCLEDRIDGSLSRARIDSSVFQSSQIDITGRKHFDLAGLEFCPLDAIDRLDSDVQTKEARVAFHYR